MPNSPFVEGVDPGTDYVPRHVAVVMDGNGRWATQRGLARTAGHTAAEEALRRHRRRRAELGVKWFTVYAFSTENWRRPPDEVRFLLNYPEGRVASQPL